MTKRPLTGRLLDLMGKRLAGTANYYLGGRRDHFAGVEKRIAALLRDLDQQDVDHALCTGDVTQMSFVEEFQRCAALFGERLQQPERHTVIPGNHDRYTHDAVRRFEEHFGRVAPPEYPFVKEVTGGVTLVLLDVARPCSLWDSSGLCGPKQLRRLKAILTDPQLADRFVVLGLHYGLLRPGGVPDRPSHAIRDYQALIDLVDDEAVHLDLILHGHMHGNYTVRTARRTVVCAGSATDLHRRCGYNVYEIDVEQRTFEEHRYVWDGEAEGYRPCSPP